MFAEILQAAAQHVGVLGARKGEKLVHGGAERAREPEAEAVHRREARQAAHGFAVLAQRAARICPAAHRRPREQHEQLPHARLHRLQIAAVRKQNGPEQLVEQAVRLLAVAARHALQKAAFQLKGIIGRAVLLLECLQISRHLALDLAGARVLEQSCFRSGVVQKTGGHEEQRGELIHAPGRHEGHVLRGGGGLLQRFPRKLRRFAQIQLEKLLPVHHEKRPGREPRLRARFTHDRRHKARKAAGAKINVFAAETLRLRRGSRLGTGAIAPAVHRAHGTAHRRHSSGRRRRKPPRSGRRADSRGPWTC